MNWVATIGLETHVQLETRSKIFCGCPNRFGAPPNTLVCPVCLGYPGALPVLNREAVRLTVQAGMLLGCGIQMLSKFDRKNYSYPDMPKNYQISQYDRPFCLGGGVEIDVGGKIRKIALTRIHLEEDVGKNTHFDGSSGVDYNRAGTPLMEIVTEPILKSADEAFAYLLALKQILVYGGISACNLEEGNLRCDVNVSVGPEDRSALGVKVEIKNMNTFKGVHRALTREIARQMSELRAGGTLRQETRRWDDAAGVTLPMRTKEDAHDYRYFPDPDLMPVELDAAQLDAWRANLPELPAARRTRFVAQYGLPEYDAGVLTADRRCADYFEAVVAAGAAAKATSNWIMTDVLRALSERDMDFSGLRLTPRMLADLVALEENRTINMPSAKIVFHELFDAGGDPREIVRRRELAQVSDASAIEAFVRKVMGENPRSVESYRAGKEAALKHLVGQVMKLSRGKADPSLAATLLKRFLTDGV